MKVHEKKILSKFCDMVPFTSKHARKRRGEKKIDEIHANQQ